MLIFLDIDGVLVTMDSWYNDQQMDQDCVRRLNMFCHFNKIDVVISSDWRIGHTLKSLKKELQDHGVDVNIIGMTPQRNDGRGNEILEWIETHKYVGDYFVIDDTIEGIEGVIPEYRIIHIPYGLYDGGLSFGHIQLMEFRMGLYSLKGFEIRKGTESVPES